MTRALIIAVALALAGCVTADPRDPAVPTDLHKIGSLPVPPPAP